MDRIATDKGAKQEAQGNARGHALRTRECVKPTHIELASTKVVIPPTCRAEDPQPRHLGAYYMVFAKASALLLASQQLPGSGLHAY